MKIDVKVVTGAAAVALAGLGVAGGIALTRGDSNGGRDQVVRQVNQTVSASTSSGAVAPGAASPAAVTDTAVTPSVTMSSPNVPPVSTPVDPAPASTPAAPAAPVSSTPPPAPAASQTATEPRTVITDADGARRAPAPGPHDPHPSSADQAIPTPPDLQP